VWLVAERRTSALASAGATAVASIVAAIWMGGIGILGDYLDVVLHSTNEASPMSIPGLLRGIGFSAPVARIGLLLVVALGCVAIVALRADRRRAFAVAVIVSVIATTVVRPETLVVALVALVPWATEGAHVAGGTSRVWPVRSPMLAVAAGVTAIAVVVSGASGGLRSSSMTLSNETAQTVIVRFATSSPDGTFGYRLAAGEVGTGWLGRIGTGASPIFVTTADCEILYHLDADPGVSALRIGETAADATEVAPAAFLDYVSDCAETVGLAVAALR